MLCYLEGMTYQQAARHLGWSEGTTQGRLRRGRNILRARLTRRGVALAGAIPGTLYTPKAGSAVSLTMLHQITQVARYFALGKSVAAESASTAAAALVRKAVRTMMIAKVMKIIAVAVLLGGAVTCVATGLAATGQDIRQDAPAESRQNLEMPSGPPSRGEATGSSLPGTPDWTAQRRTRRHSPRAQDQATQVDRSKPDLIGKGEPVNLSRDLMTRGRLNRGDSVFSSLGGFRLRLRHDGNLVLYVIDEKRVPAAVRGVLSHSPEAMTYYTTEVWSTGTNVAREGAGPGFYCIMHDDGNFVIYDKDSRPCFETNTHGFAGSFLRCQNDGNVVIYTPDLDAVWHSGTYSRPTDSFVGRLDGSSLQNR